MNKLEKTSLAAGLFFGATGVILGAVGSHALKEHLAETLEIFSDREQIPDLPCSVFADIGVITK